MRRLLLGVLTAAILVSALGSPASASWRDRTARYARWDGRGGWTQHEVRLTIRSAVGRWPVPGGVPGALCIARHESGFQARDLNRSSGASGVYQFLRSTWSRVVSRAPEIVRRWSLSRSAFNARSNVVLAVRIAHAGGWSAWSVRFACGLG